MKKIIQAILFIMLVFVETAIIAEATPFISVGGSSSIGIKSDAKTLFVWGDASSGKLGDRTVGTILNPVTMYIPGNPIIQSIAMGSTHAIALTSNGTLFSWGLNDIGQLGNGTAGIISKTPVTVLDATGSPVTNIVDIAIGGSHTVALKSDGTLLSWGENTGWNQTSGAPKIVTDAAGNPVTGITTISVGTAHTLALRTDGTVLAWGENSRGQLGDGTTVYRSNPVPVVDVAGMLVGGVAAISAGFEHSAILKRNGTVLAFGADGVTLVSSLPRLITDQTGAATSGVKAIATGSYFTLALKTDGTVLAWGGNNKGELGDGTALARSIPVFVNDATGSPIQGISAIAAGSEQAVVSKSDGTLLAWGDNFVGTLGVGSNQAYQSYAAPVINADGTAFHASGFAPFPTASAIMTTASVTGMSQIFPNDPDLQDTHQYTITVSPSNGIATVNALGLVSYTPNPGTSGIDSFSVTVADSGSPSLSGVVSMIAYNGAVSVPKVAAGEDNSAVLKGDGTAQDWGVNDVGQLGNGASGYGAFSNIPVSVSDVAGSPVSGLKDIAVGRGHSIALKSDGTVLAWGYNADGQLGDGTTTNNSQAIVVNDAIGNPLMGIIAVAAGQGYSFALKNNGTLLAWGNNSRGELGDGTTTLRLRPTAVIDITGNAITGVMAMAAGRSHSMALKSDGTLLEWGNDKLHPIVVNNATGQPINDVVAIAEGELYSVILKRDGTMLAWGDNTNGQLGNLNPIVRGWYSSTTSYPTLVTDAAGHPITGVQAIAAGGSHTLALKHDGTLLAWGSNSAGQLGDGSIVERRTPVVVVDAAGNPLRDIISIAAGREHSLVLKLDGSLLSWGGNQLGQLGDGSKSLEINATVVRNSVGVPVLAAKGQDTTPPVISVPADITIAAPDANGAPKTYPALASFLSAGSAYDGIDGNVPVALVATSVPASFPVGQSTVQFEATDSSGNRGVATAVITVVIAASEVFPLNGVMPIGWQQLNGAQGSWHVGQDAVSEGFFSLRSDKITDNEFAAIGIISPASGIISFDYKVDSKANSDGLVFRVKNTLHLRDSGNTGWKHGQFPVKAGDTVYWNYFKDGSGASGADAAWIDHVVFTEDITPPVLSSPGNFSFPTIDSNGVPRNRVGFIISAIDNLDGVITTINDDAPSIFPLGVTTVTFSATDSAGLTGTVKVTITVIDQGVPVVTPPIDIIVVNHAAATDASIVAFLGRASAVDLVDGVITNISNDATTPFPLGTTTVTFSATDTAGNVGTTTATVTVITADITTPVVSAPINIGVLAVDANGTSASDTAIAAFLTAATALDNIDGKITATATLVTVPSIFPMGITTVEFEAIDAAGNRGIATATVIVVDAATGLFPLHGVMPAGWTQTVGADASWHVVQDFTSEGMYSLRSDTVLDNQYASIDVTAPVSGTIRYDYKVDSEYGADGFVVMINGNAPQAGVSGSTTWLSNLYPVKAGDIITWVYFKNGSISTGIDAAWIDHVRFVKDTTPPVVTPPANITITALNPYPGALTGGALIDAFINGATATDNVDGNIAQISMDWGNEFPLGVTTLTFAAQDSAGLWGTATATVTVLADTIAPVVTPPANIIVDAVNANGALSSNPIVVGFLRAATATDNDPGVTSAYPQSALPGLIPMGATTVTFSAVDAWGNEGLATATITVIADLNPPVITAPANIVVAAETPAGTAPSNALIASFLNGATALDAGSGSFAATAVTTTVPATFPIGTTIVSFEAIDNVGNRSTATATIRVVDAINDLFPANAMMPVGWAPYAGQTLGWHVASDFATEGLFSLRSDSIGNNEFALIEKIASVSGTVNFDYKVDSEAGRDGFVFLVNYADVLVEAAGNTGWVHVSFPVQAGDSMIWSYFKDAAGSSGQDAAWIDNVFIGVDSTPPVITVPADMTIAAVDASGIPNNAATTAFLNAVTAADIVDGIIVNISNDAPNVYPLGVTTITFSATDLAGNLATTTASVTVVDRTPPSITVAADIIIEANAVLSTVNIGATTATDLVDSIVVVASDAPAGFALGTTTVTWTATDTAGNKATATQNISVIDSTAPSLAQPVNITGIEATSVAGAVLTFALPLATDIADIAPVVSCLPASDSVFPLGLNTVTCTATDASSNSTAVNFTIHVVDTTAPTVTAPPAMSIEATNSLRTLYMPIITAAASDNVGVSGVVHNAPVDLPFGTTIVTWTATDAAGNMATAIQHVTVLDSTAPVMTAPAAVIATAAGLQTTLVLTAPLSTDLFGPVTMLNNAPLTFPLGLTTVIWTATDANGNSATVAQAVNVNVPNIALLTPMQIALLTPAQLALLSPAQVIALTAPQLTAMTPAQLGLLGMTLTPAQVGTLLPTQLAVLLPSLNAAQVAGLTAAQITLLTPAQLALLSPAQVIGLTAPQLTAMTTVQLGSLGMTLTPAQVGTLLPTQLAVLLPSLNAAQIAGLTSVQLVALTPAQLGVSVASLSAAQLAMLTPIQVAALAPTQLGVVLPLLTPTQLAFLVPAQIATLTTLQVGTLNSAQLAALPAWQAQDEDKDIDEKDDDEKTEKDDSDEDDEDTDKEDSKQDKDDHDDD